MENYVVSARKYRPATFASVVGQKALTATLKNSIATDRLAHAYLFCGSRGVGKTSCARIFAKTINCEHRTPDGEACNECESCRSFNENRSLNIIELDAASNNGVEDIRTLVEQVQVPPTLGRYRVFIVDEVHMLSTSAFNAFLKTLEEPPAYVIFILATTEKHKIIPTILSRCQIYDFNRITIQDMVNHLAYVASQEGISVEPSALGVIARKADGAMRDALSIFDQVAASSMGNVTYSSTIENLNVLDSDYYSRLLDAMLSGNVADALLIYKDIRDRGFDSHFFITGLADYFRDLLVARDGRTAVLLEAADDVRAAMTAQAGRCSAQFLFKAMDLCNQADMNYRAASNKQFLVELTLIKLCQAACPSSDSSGSGEGRSGIQPITSASATATTSATPAQQHPAQTQATAPAPVAASPVAARQPVSSVRTVAPKPAAPAPKPAGHPLRTTMRGLAGLSINNVAAAVSDRHAPVAAEAAVEYGAKRATAFSDAEFASAWARFIDTHPKAQLLVATMKLCRPVKIADAHYRLTVDSRPQIDSIQADVPVLLDFLRSELANDNVAIDFTVSESESRPSALTDREVLAHMFDENPGMRLLADEFHLTLN